MQNYNNHIRFYALHHFISFPLGLALFIWSIFEWINSGLSDKQSIFMVGVSLLLILILFVARIYAIKNQDRIIKMEMRQRFFELSGKRFKDTENKLRTSQIIALRFASDDELIDLMNQAVNDNMNAKSIKQNIKNWQPDYKRV